MSVVACIWATAMLLRIYLSLINRRDMPCGSDLLTKAWPVYTWNPQTGMSGVRTLNKADQSSVTPSLWPTTSQSKKHELLTHVSTFPLFFFLCLFSARPSPGLTRRTKKMKNTYSTAPDITMCYFSAALSPFSLAASVLFFSRLVAYLF